MRRKQFLKKTLSVTLAAAMALTVSQATTFAETDSILNGISSYAAENNGNIQVCLCRSYLE